ncbi:uncharacterized protein LOC143358045 isoform X2 [Halictus rubicundus]|uniref:uncharacterized protein LOC143358045 isoform X2 n=1 Tax=Halictus rubicundus TaxID=77578 RepID=UPI0040352F8E
MANARNTRLRFLESQIEESLKSLLQEGSKYSHILEKLYHRNRSAYSDIQKVLCIMDNYSRVGA